MVLQEMQLVHNEIKRIIPDFEEIPDNILSTGVQTKWKRGYRGKGGVVAVLDSGCQTNHPDLQERIIGGYNFTAENNGDITIYEDYNGHGTHVAGVIGGSVNKVGIVGISPKVDLLILKVLNKRGAGSTDSLVEAINYAIDWRGINNEKVRVISLSLGIKRDVPKLHEAIKRAISNNVSVVASSGNDGDGNASTAEYRFPGSYPEAIVVGAANYEKNVAHFSNTNEYVDLYAPGVGIYSAYMDGEYKILAGTSMATAHVSGAIALLIEEYEHLLSRKLNEDEVFKLLMKHTTVVDTEMDVLITVLDLNQKVTLERKEVVYNG